MKKIIFPNGLRLILAPERSGTTATVLILVEAGSEYETKAQNGISHFLEHLVFKGTKKRPTPRVIASELDGLGAVYNAFTGQEYTGYWAKVQSGKVHEILEIVSDLYLNPIFHPDEIQRERGVIIEEINMIEDTPMRKIHDFLGSLMYGDQPAGWQISGEKEVILELQREDFIGYRTKHYIAPATTVVVAGNFDSRKVLKDVQTTFGHLPKKRKNRKSKTRESQTHPRVFMKFKESDQTHLVFGFRAFSIFDSRRFPLQVLANHLGGGMSSRLFQRVREELGAAYYIHASSDLSLDHGHLAISAGVDHKKIEQVIKVVLEECRQLVDQRLSPKELKKAKDHLVGNLLIGLDTSDEVANFYGGQEILTGKILSPQQIVKEVRAVTVQDIQRVARFLFQDDRLNFAVIGPLRDEPGIKKILHF